MFSYLKLWGPAKQSECHEFVLRYNLTLGWVWKTHSASREWLGTRHPEWQEDLGSTSTQIVRPPCGEHQHSDREASLWGALSELRPSCVPISVWTRSKELAGGSLLAPCGPSRIPRSNKEGTKNRIRN